MQTGLSALHKSLDEARASKNSSGGGGYLKWLSWKPGERKIVRFLSDDIITGEFYQGVICKGREGKQITQTFLIDPTKGDYVAKHGAKKLDWTKQVVDATPKPCGAGIVVVRQEVPKKQGRGTEIVELYENIEVRGTTYQSRTFGVILQSLNTDFWSSLAFLSDKNGTLTNRDYEIYREGEKLNTTYHIYPCDPDPELTELQVMQDFYGYGRPWPKQPEEGQTSKEWDSRFLYCPKTSSEWMEEMSSEERFKELVFGTDTPQQQTNGLGEFHPNTTHNDEAQASMTSTPTFSSLRDIMRPHKSN